MSAEKIYQEHAKKIEAEEARYNALLEVMIMTMGKDHDLFMEISQKVAQSRERLDASYAINRVCRDMWYREVISL